MSTRDLLNPSLTNKHWTTHTLFCWFFLQFGCCGVTGSLLFWAEFHVDMTKRAGRVGSGQSGCGSNGSLVKTGHFKKVKNGFKSIVLWVRSGWPVFFTWIFFLIFYFYKENNMYLPFGKLCNKLLDVKCIILNSPLISRINSVKLINTYSIILTLYKS